MLESDKADRALVIGIGNTNRGDDAVGSVTVDRLRSHIPACIRLVQQAGEGTDLINLWQTNDVPVVFLVDAMSSGLPAGTILRCDVHKTPLPANFDQHSSTHAFGLVEAIELARVLGCLPHQVVVYGIEGQCFDYNAPLSAEVDAASLIVVEHITSECLGLIENQSINDVTP